MPEAVELKTPSELRKLINLAYFFLVLGALAWAKDFLLHVVFTGLLSLLLTPMVSWLESHGFRRVLAVLTVVAVAFIAMGVLCTVVSTQALDLINSVPKYRSNIISRWESLQHGPVGVAHPGLPVGEQLGRAPGAEHARQPDAKFLEQPSRIKVEVMANDFAAGKQFRPICGAVAERLEVKDYRRGAGPRHGQQPDLAAVRIQGLSRPVPVCLNVDRKRAGWLL